MKGDTHMQTFYADVIVIMEMLIFGIIAFIIPGTLTVWNIYNCISKNPKKEKLISTLTILVGGLFYLFLFAVEYDEAGEWYEQVNPTQYHNSFSSEYWLIDCVVISGFVGYFVLLYVRADKLPPLISAISISALILLNIIQISYAIQISKNVEGIGYLLYVYHANILLLSARVIHRHMREETELFRNRITSNENSKKVSFLFNKIVKPLRLGTRRNETIIVNRQLCIANAFEELIQEKTPRFHRWIRAFYDTYGYPLSRKITTPVIADIIYILMKPLEWAFLIFLYAFDLRPEQRIARQYIYNEPNKKDK